MSGADARRLTVEGLLERARAQIVRRTPEDAWASGEQIIDIRGDAQVAAHGTVPGALWFERNVLEWRVDPSSAHRDPRVAGLDEGILLLCAEGYQSSLAAASLRELGFARAGDVIGGFNAWRAAGLPTTPWPGA